MKRCSTCREEKPLSDFSKDSYRPDGLRTYCKRCGVDYSMGWEARNRERRNARRRENPPPSNQGDGRHDLYLKRAYGITHDDYAEMLEEQGYGCAICGGTDESRRLAVDHCHETQRVRGLLCGRCNRGLGHFGDDPELMHRAVEYLAA